MGQADITHSYPHCWRCKSPSSSAPRPSGSEHGGQRTAPEGVEGHPQRRGMDSELGRGTHLQHDRGSARLCISRQRLWGVPILALLCEDCGEAWNDPEWMRDIVARFAKHPTGCDYWYEADMKDIVPEGLKCPAGPALEARIDILDVWFDSGTSFAAVLEKRPELGFPADLYLEGSDQHAAGSIPRCSLPSARAASRPTGDAHARLRGRRRRPQDVQVHRQRHRATRSSAARRGNHPHVGIFRGLPRGMRIFGGNRELPCGRLPPSATPAATCSAP